uniref:Uncharacterized protein n=1 Tax=Brassica campestris TaxID=3711 RepID=A0A3P6D092_BRACM|nr:unnamed protein product [Brassica rapa]
MTTQSLMVSRLILSIILSTQLFIKWVLIRCSQSGSIVTTTNSMMLRLLNKWLGKCLL